MDGFLLRVPPAQADQLFISTETAAALLDTVRVDATQTLRLDDAWCALHFVLTNELPIMKRYNAVCLGTISR